MAAAKWIILDAVFDFAIFGLAIVGFQPSFDTKMGCMTETKDASWWGLSVRPFTQAIIRITKFHRGGVPRLGTAPPRLTRMRRSG